MAGSDSEYCDYCQRRHNTDALCDKKITGQEFDSVQKLLETIVTLTMKLNQVEKERDEFKQIGKQFEDDSRKHFSQSCINLDRAKLSELDRDILAQELKSARKTLTKDGNLIIKFSSETFNDKLEYSLARIATDTSGVLSRIKQ